MKTMFLLSPQKRLQAFSWVAVCALATVTLGAQSIPPRIASEINGSESTPLKGSLNPRAQANFDTGRMAGDTRLNGISIVFSRSAAQQADLDALIAAQQNPASPLYHQWLSPDQFGARFGMAESDLAKVEAWLEQQGFSIDSVARSRNLIRFSGTAAQAEQAFKTEMHTFTVGGVRHFAPSTELSLPAALAPSVLAVRNLDDFRPRSYAVMNPARLRPSFTSSQSGNVYFAPGDIATVYDINPLYSASYNGTGQSITIVGQSAITVSDIENFQKAALLTVKDPVQVLVPGTGTSTINPFGQTAGDELESDLDLEWSGAIAPGAAITFVYTGSNTAYGAFDSIQYAIDEKIGTIVSASYGDCEVDIGSASLASLDSIIQQGTAQGQTVISSSGDSGSTACNEDTNLTTAQQNALAVNYPASSAYVTGLGGTEVSSTADNGDYLIAGDGYWEAQNASLDEINSALKYIPEVTWNDDLISEQNQGGLSATGGGASAYFAKPSWQTGVPGIPADGKRDVPDLALYSSPLYPGYLFCSSDPSTGVTGSCANGFRDANNASLTVAGGTSFAAPIFAGMVAIINQKQGYTTGQGLINPTLYTQAANSSTYGTAFHDITSGNNNCLGGTTYCGSTPAGGFSAGTGYDQVTGLGSVDLNNLVGGWPANTGTGASLIGTNVTVVPANAAPAVNTADNFTITVTSTTGSTIPTGTLTLVIDGGPSNGGPANVSATLTANGTYIYAATFATAGTHQVLAQYSGDSTHAASSGVGQVTIASVSSGKGTFALAASPSTLTVSQGSSGTETITVTPAGGYTGTVLLAFQNLPSALNNLCYDFPNINSSGYGPVTVSGTSPASTTLMLDTNATDCATGAAQVNGKGLHRLGGVHTSKNNVPGSIPAGIAFAGLLLAGFLGRSSRKFGALAGLLILVAAGLSISACGGGSGGITVSDPPKGTYTITVSGQDSVTSSITGSTSFTFTIQ